jgi:3-hydroxyacyl-[acyl-carrier-protein] dehydratase
LIEISALPHRPPFLFIDRILELVPGEKGAFLAQWTTSGHYLSAQAPPSFSQALLVEAMAEAAGLVLIAVEEENEGQVPAEGYLLRLDRASFHTWPRAGEGLRLFLNKKRRMGHLVLFSGEAYSDNRLVMQADLTLWHGKEEEGN